MPTAMPSPMERRFLSLMDTIERTHATEIAKMQAQIAELMEALSKEKAAREALSEQQQNQIKALQATVSAQGKILRALLPQLDALETSVSSLGTSLDALLAPLDMRH